MSITIRKVLPEEAYEFAVLHINCWRDAYNGIIPEDYLDNMTVELNQRVERHKQSIENPNGCEFYCVICDNKMIGMLIFAKSQDEDKPDAGDVIAIYLLKEYWGKGYGKQMMDFAVAELRKSKYKEIIIWVLEENTRGIHFYEKYGMIHDGAEKEMQLGKPLKCIRYVL